MAPEFHKSFMLKRLIKKYWQGEIEGDDWEKIKKKVRAWRKKDIFIPDDSEVEKSEREGRKKIRKLIELNKPRAEATGKFIKAVYLYETKNGEYKSRPKESYSYNVEIEIGDAYSSEESVYILSEILYVRYGKMDIKVMPNENVYDKISGFLNIAIEK